MSTSANPGNDHGGASFQSPALQPWDVHNRRLLEQVHPPDWVNPEPAPRYNLVVVGGGTAGLVTAAGAAGLGARVALVERHLLGGDCLNVGCVPSKALIRASRALSAVREAADFGIHVEGARVDFGAVMERVRRLRAEISPHDSAARFRGLGVDVFFGSGRFTGPDRIEVGGRALAFSRAVVATGGRAGVPAIPGLEKVPYLTNETLFSLVELPPRLGVIGAGPIGCEMAQAFARLGSQVTLVEGAHGVLPREDRDAAGILEAAMTRDGVRLACCARQLEVSAVGDGTVRLRMESHGQQVECVVDRLLIAAGRAPNVEGLGLESAGVACGPKGIQVNDRLQTTNPRVYACGDVCSPFQFTHAADFLARIVIQNALFRGRAKASALLIPRCTYTSPEIAHVGWSEAEARERGWEVDTFTQDFRAVDRAILDGETDGFVRVHVRKGTDTLVGATLVAAHAGELVSELTLAMNGKLGLKAIASTLHPYPTQADAIRRTGDVYNRKRLTPFVRALFDRWCRWDRR